MLTLLDLHHQGLPPHQQEKSTNFGTNLTIRFGGKGEPRGGVENGTIAIGIGRSLLKHRRPKNQQL